ncbi:metal/formaldehyde-sensitive transcriptional repressor [uncultured Alteromonas sp.]|jgi:DNA-binding FrmR family transcriptional regulator|uniref:metal/formaldehyde-sensitive transcriptional repressor n=1 Tax=uncultured Alteromonas sp. TaxID=179113 RepID=UPI0025FE108C|nr:metal/formaldehyde-sensitive transcriptional repressor [uncultured Alteromonas sp.]
MAHIHKNQQALLTRVKKIRGQLNAVEKSMNEGNECLAILQQVTAIKGAVNGLMTTILEDHIREHVGKPGLSDTERTEEVEALNKILKSYLK